MKLNEKILLSLILLVLLLAGTLVFSLSFYLEGYEKLDDQEACSSLHNALLSLNASRQGLARILADWAVWDDSYAFIKNPDDPAFIESNLNAVTMANLDSDIFVITGPDKAIVWGKMYDRANNTLAPLPGEISSAVYAIDTMMEGERENETVSGIVVLSTGPMIIGSAPVTRSDGTGPVTGRFAIGTHLDATHVAEAASVSSPTLAFIPVRDDRIPDDIRSALLAGPASDPVTITRNASVLSTFVLIDDIYGNPALVATADTPRQYYLQAESSLLGGFLILLTVIVLVGALVFILINRYVLRRLRILQNAADRIRGGGTLTATVNVGGDDEITDMAVAFNQMIRAIETGQKEVDRSREQFRNLAENTADVLFTLDRTGSITYVSPQVSQYGFAPDDLKGKTFLSFIHPQDRRVIAGNFLKMMETGENFSSAFRIINRDGSTSWVEERSNILYDSRKKPLGIQGVIRDITDRKRAEDAIRLANRKLNLMNDITRHDIINTLTGLLGTVDMAMDPAQKANRDLFLADIRQLALTIQRQIEFTRQYQAVGVKEPVWQDLSQIIGRAAELSSGSGVTIIKDIDTFEVFADPLLEKVFYNLIQNALSYGKHVTAIRFSEEISDRGFAIVCEDNGVGIPDEMKEKIFERGIGKNTGLGLFLSREILAITGITIHENGIFEKGARFELILPKGGYRFPSEKKG